MRAFSISMDLKGTSNDLFAYVFPLTLDADPSKWFRALNKIKLNDQDYIREEFREQYMYNTHLPIGMRELELTNQNSNEDFVTFCNIWREKFTQMTNMPSQEDQARLVIRNLQPKYGDHINFQPIESFTNLYKVGLVIKEEV